MEISIDLSNIKEAINPHFFPLLKDKNRFLVLKGGRGSGKSHFIAQKILIRIFHGFETGAIHRVLCLRKTQPSVRRSVYKLFRTILSDWDLMDEKFVKINRSDMTFKFWNGSDIICGGLDEPSKIKSIVGITGIWLEECDEMTLNDFKEMNLAMRGKFPSYKQIILSFNPRSKLLWLYNEFWEKKKKNATLHHSTYQNNPYLALYDPEYIEELESYKDIDQNFYRIYTLGEWGQLTESIYSNYEIINNFPDEKFFKDCAYGLDVGFNAPTALAFVGVHDEEYYIKELLYETKMTHNKIIQKLGELIPLKHRRERIIYVDSAEPELIKELNHSGFVAKKSDKSVKDGVNYCKRSKLYIDKDSVNLCKEIGAYSYRKNNDGIVLEEPIKINDHLCDAFRYPIYTHWGKLRPRASLVFV